MYDIYRSKDGKFYCAGRLQDGTERWTCDTLEDAVRQMKDFAYYTNHQKIKKKDIQFFDEQTVTEMKYVPWKPFR